MQNYNDFASTFAKSRKNLRWQELDTIISDIIQNNYKNILDIGCGSGRFLDFFLKQTNTIINYTGIDNSKNMIMEAKKQFPNHNFMVSEMESINTSQFKKSFDAIIFLASFHHLNTLEKRIQTLKNIHSILSENGKIYMTNWNLREQEKYQSSEFAPWEFYIKIGEFERYYHSFSLQELENIFLQTEYNIEKNEIFEGGRNFLSILSKQK